MPCPNEAFEIHFHRGMMTYTQCFITRANGIPLFKYDRRLNKASIQGSGSS